MGGAVKEYYCTVSGGALDLMKRQEGGAAREQLKKV